MEANGSEPIPFREIPSDAITTYERVQQIQSREARESGERRLRFMYALAFLSLIVFHLGATWTVVFLLGFSVITLDRWVATTFISGSLSQVVGLLWLVTRYLFPSEPGAATTAAR